MENTQGYISYQLSSEVLTSASIFGVAILILCLVSFFIHRKNVLSRISLAWVCLSVISVVIVGWGSAENGVVLYALYFGWAFFVLLFQLVVWTSRQIKRDSLVYIISGMFITCILAMNISGIQNLLAFAIEFYPL